MSNRLMKSRRLDYLPLNVSQRDGAVPYCSASYVTELPIYCPKVFLTVISSS